MRARERPSPVAMARRASVSNPVFQMLPLHSSYSPPLVALSVLVGAAASYTALDLAGRVTAARGRLRSAWLAGSALAMGAGIWSMHFVGMLAFHLDAPVAYAAGPLVLSVVVAVGASALTFAVVSRPLVRTRTLVAGALFLGPAIAGMHYVGMAALRTPAHLSYDPTLVTLSLAIAISASFAALWLAHRLRGDDTRAGRWRKAGSATVMGLAIAGMHYTGMVAAHFSHAPLHGAAPAAGIDCGAVVPSRELAGAVALGTFLVLALALIAAVVDRWLHALSAETEAIRRAQRALRASEARFRTVVGALAEGVVLTDCDDVIEYVNPRLAALTGYAEGELLGRVAHQLLLPPTEWPRYVARLAAWRQHEASQHEASQHEAADPAADRYEGPYVHKDGTRLWLEIGGVPLCDDAGAVVGAVATVWDVTERKRLEERLRHDAHHDPLTGLPNRTLFRARVEAALARAARAGGAAAGAIVAVLFVDLDDFKTVNDSLGHGAGDALLTTVARRLLHETRGCDAVARLGGDEFAVLLDGVRGPAEAVVVAARILQALEHPVPLEGTEVRTGASVGIATSRHAETAEALLRDADVAMYAAKHEGKQQYCVFEPAMHAAALTRLQFEAELRRAVADLTDQGVPAERDADARVPFRLEYQPIVRLSTGEIRGVEALVRWQHSERGVVPPAAFIPLAEETGLIVPLGRWVLHTACCPAGARRRAFPGAAALRVTVNVAARQLRDPALVDDVRDALAAGALPGDALLLEITESALMQQPEFVKRTLAALKALGVRIAVDDFGTGYSSLSYLQQFPVDVLKIDRTFVGALRAGTPCGVPQDAQLGPVEEPAGGGPTDERPAASGPRVDDAALVRAIVHLGHTLALETVAEGIEDARQAAALHALGCVLGQGYHFARPLAPACLTRLLAPGPVPVP